MSYHLSRIVHLIMLIRLDEPMPDISMSNAMNYTLDMLDKNEKV